MDLGAVRAAATADLATCAVGAAANARDLVSDAEVLSGNARHARAYALGALAVEEAGKALSLSALAMMPGSLRARAPLRRMLEWHQLKLVGGMLMAAVPPRDHDMAARLAAMPLARVEAIMDTAHVLAQDQDRLKQRGLYADIDADGRVRLPSEVTGADVPAQLGLARQAMLAASVLLEPDAAHWLAHPPAESIELCRALVSAFADAGTCRTSQAAADVLLEAVTKLQGQAPSSGPERT